MNIPQFRFVFDRKKTATKKTKGLVQIEVLHERKRKWIGTGVKLYSDQWNERRLVVNHPQSMQLNDTLNKQMGDLRDWANSLAKDGVEFEMGMIGRFLAAEKATTETFVQYAARKLDERQDIRESTKRTQNKLIGALEEFGGLTYFSDLTPKSIMAFDNWLHGRYTQQSTIHSYHKFAKIYINMAIKDGLIKEDPYLGMRIDRGKPTDIKYLTEEELAAFESAEILDPSLQRVRDLFLFQAYTGMAYADMAKFDFTQVQSCEDGKMVFKGTRQKSSEKFITLLLPKVVEILKRYGYHLPIITNQKYNLYLKTAGQIAGIRKPLTSHMARHTFATMMLHRGVKIENLAKMLGHTDIATTQIYAKVLAKDVLDDFAKAFGE